LGNGQTYASLTTRSGGLPRRKELEILKGKKMIHFGRKQPREFLVTITEKFLKVPSPLLMSWKKKVNIQEKRLLRCLLIRPYPNGLKQQGDY